jgi:acyl-CoA ligase (AMP-forming) (exosortase A-associated)
MSQILDDTPYPLDHLSRRAAEQQIAIEDRQGVLTYGQLDAMVGSTAAALLSGGLSAGDRVASWLPKTRLACILPLACARAGLVYVPVNPILKHLQTAHIVRDSGARLLITGQGRAGSLQLGDIPADCRIELEGTQTDAWFNWSTTLPPSNRNPDELVALLYTSGSTGKPKGVMLSHANLWLGAVSVAHYLRLDAMTRTLCVLPFAFDYGQNQLFSTWMVGGRVIPLDYLSPRDVINAVQRFDANTLAGVPPLWTQLAEASWPYEAAGRLRCITNSGGRLSVALVRRLRALFPDAKLHSMYGLTEAFRSTSLDPDLIDDHPDAIGTAIPFARVFVVRNDGSLASPGEPGELVHAGSLVAQGYWQDAERTAARFRDAPAEAGTGRAVWSGDTVVQGEDGLLHFIGRDDLMIKTAGNRVSPTEIEEEVMATGVTSEVVALGVPDDRLGQAILLIAKGIPAQEKDLRDRLKRDLPTFMQPRNIVWLDELPRTPNGKLDVTALRKEFGE